ncbi:hypothetical protein FJZ31_30285 [Candidatus Poribacteria bacterium]|nr:hypothetical protein [Candidatus Poribacteria bacterium]
MKSASNYYPRQEPKFLIECYEFVNPNCSLDCFCRKNGCDGVWVLKDNVSYDVFVYHYANLWARGSEDFINKVSNDNLEIGQVRWSAGIQILRRLKNNWNNFNSSGESLPQKINKIRRCFFCNDSFEITKNIIEDIKSIVRNSGVYRSKLISSLFYDIIIPFDTESRDRQENCGYNPEKYGLEMRKDALEFLIKNKLSIDEFRNLDDAKEKYWDDEYNQSIPYGTVCSRVIDKLFYGW